LSCAQWEQTRAACGCTMKREKETTIHMVLFFFR
jgi:hypothetical protein